MSSNRRCGWSRSRPIPIQRGRRSRLDHRRRHGCSTRALPFHKRGRAGPPASRRVSATFGDDDRPAFIEEDVPTVDVLVARAQARRDYLARN